MGTGIFGISLTGLNVAQQNMATTSQNIANVNTDGYHRQTLLQSTAKPQATGSSGTIGSGVNSTDVTRAYSQFLDGQINQNQGQLSSYEAYGQYATQLNSLTGSTDSAFANAMSSFFSSMQEVANDPTSLVARQGMISSGINLSQQYSSVSTGLTNMANSINTDLKSMTSQVNNYAQTLAKLNGQIAVTQASGGNTNQLLDQRDSLVAEINKLINVSVVNQQGSGYNLYLADGQPLVVGGQANSLTTVQNPSGPTGELVPALQIGSTTITLSSSQISGGQISGILNFRDQMLTPTQSGLKNIVDQLVTAVNTQHASGEDLNGNPGGAFFNTTSSASGFSVAISDPNLIAAASTGEGPGGNSNILALIGVQSDTTYTGLNGQTLQGSFTNLVGKNASYESLATSNQNAYQSLTDQATQAQQSFSGVNLDEEAANLIKYQQAYQAAAKALQVSSGLFNDILSALQ